MWAKLSNGAVDIYPYSLERLKADNPNTSFPYDPPLALLAEWGVVPVTQVAPPWYNQTTHNCVKGTPEWDGTAWVEVWDITPASAEEVEQRTIAARSFMSLSFAQLLIGLVTEGWITAAEGRAWRDRVALPAPVQTLIASLPAAEQFAAETRALAPSEVLRLDPLVLQLGAAQGKTPEELDTFFQTYSQA